MENPVRTSPGAREGAAISPTPTAVLPGKGCHIPTGQAGKGGAGVPRGSLTRVAHRGVQQVHARSSQTQPIDCIRRLLKIRHHAKVVWRRKFRPNRGHPAGRSRFTRGEQIQGPWWVGLEWWNYGQSKQTEVLVYCFGGCSASTFHH